MKWIIISGGIIVVLAAVGRSGDDTKSAFQKSAPSYAAAFTNDYSFNACIVETAPRLRATRADYLEKAKAVCSIQR